MECQRRTAVILKEIWARENADVAISPILTGIGVLP
jgi:hypothetical protein